MGPPLPPDPYEALGVDTKADAATIKTAYRKLVLKSHPDKFPDPELKAVKQDEFQKIQQAYEILSDDKKRADYDIDVAHARDQERLHKLRNAAAFRSNSGVRHVNVNIRTAEPRSPYQSPSSKSGFSPYSPGAPFTQSWESASKHARSSSDDQKPRRERSYDKRQEDDRYARRDAREDEAMRAEAKRAREKEQRRKEKEDRKREEAEALMREQAKLERKARKRDEEEAARKEQEKQAKRRDRLAKEEKADKARRRDVEEKRSKGRPLESYFEELDVDDDDIRRSSARKSSSKKRPDEPIREKSSMSFARDEPAADTTQTNIDAKLAHAQDYLAKHRRDSGRDQRASVEDFAQGYPDPEKWSPHIGSPSRRGSHDTARREPVVMSADPEARAEFRPSPLQKSYTFTEGARSSMPREPGVQRSRTFLEPEVYAAEPVPDVQDKQTRRAGRRVRQSSLEVQEVFDEPPPLKTSNSRSHPLAQTYDDVVEPQVKTSRSRPSLQPSYSYKVKPDSQGSYRTVKPKRDEARDDLAYMYDHVQPASGFTKIRTAQSYSEQDVTYASRSSPNHGTHAYSHPPLSVR